MSGSFRRPIGAQADVKELEYVVALHQTCLPTCREDATVSSLDMQRFLKSRLGIVASHAHCLRIVRGLSGGVLSQEAIEEICRVALQTGSTKDEPEFPQKEGVEHDKSEAAKEDSYVLKEQVEAADEEDEEPLEFLDMVQLTAALLIPTLARAGKEWRDVQESTQRHHIEVDQGAQSNEVDGSPPRRRVVAEEPEIDESLRPKPTTLIPDALTILLQPLQEHVGENASKYPSVTPSVVKTLLEANGEHERAADRKLVQQMVEAASSSSGLLDEEAFVNAVTSDVSQYPVASEDRVTSGFYDVYGFESRLEMKQKLEQEKEKEHTEEETGDAPDHDIEIVTSVNHDTTETPHEKRASNVENCEPYKLNMARIWSSIDFAVDAHSSVALMVGIWVFFIGTTIVYATLFHQIDGLQPKCNKDSFGCQLGGTIRTWVTFAVIFVLSGYLIIIPLSAGNSPRRRSPRSTLFSFCMCILYTWIPYLAVERYEEHGGKPKSDARKALNNRNYNQAQWLVTFIGIILLVLYLIQFVLSLIGNRRIRSSKFLNKWFGSASIRGFAKTKRAATRKINTLLLNAHRLHSCVSGVPDVSSQSRLLLKKSAVEETMANYMRHGESFEDCGGLFWTWKMICSGKLFDTEGIWIASRIIVIQFAQLALFIFITFVAFRFVNVVANAADEATADLSNYEILPDWVYDIVPTGKQSKGALYPAACVAVIVMLILISIYIPSYVGKTLRYRSGMIPSLKSPYFTKYRTTVDLVYGNLGNAIFALLGAAFLFWALTALALFLLIWPFSRGFMILVIAWGIGLTITILLKMVMTKTCRANFYTGFYRARPGAANLSTLALECWFIGMGGGVLVGRFTQFILAACFWVGRTDAPFLSDDVNLMGYAFDYVPNNFVKDILVHDAHHHPYLERLFTMYLLKLKNDEFCSDAGACWRQLFVVSFMPWLMKNRVFSDRRLEDALEAYKNGGLELEKEEHLDY